MSDDPARIMERKRAEEVVHQACGRIFEKPGEPRGGGDSLSVIVASMMAGLGVFAALRFMLAHPEMAQRLAMALSEPAKSEPDRLFEEYCRFYGERTNA